MLMLMVRIVLYMVVVVIIFNVLDKVCEKKGWKNNNTETMCWFAAMVFPLWSGLAIFITFCWIMYKGFFFLKEEAPPEASQ